MLHALLHSKLDESTPEPRRIEDAVTSSVFGTLLLADAIEILGEWLSLAQRTTGSTGDLHGPLRGYWFWPRMSCAEPDLVLRLGKHLILVEAKVASGRHDLGGEPEEISLRDQLSREWQCLVDARSSGSGDMGQAAAECDPCLVLVVDQRRMKHARREFEESSARLPPQADLRLLTWQSLHRVLSNDRRRRPDHPWSRDLVAYLEVAGLDAFLGFRYIPMATPSQRVALGTRMPASATAFRSFPGLHGCRRRRGGIEAVTVGGGLGQADLHGGLLCAVAPIHAVGEGAVRHRITSFTVRGTGEGNGRHQS